MVCILKTIAAWGVLVFLGINLIGLIARGICWVSPPIEAPTDRVRELLSRESRRMKTANVAMIVLSVLLAVGYLVALIYFWNFLLALAAATIMVARIPDLLWEIRTGKAITRENAPKTPIHIVATILLFGALPLVWYALCEWSP